ncbi:hypothetical protein BN77_4053 [Rhizobium mesoamericanum STM3625]|uniref:Uncharacterized protein n=1 Tax=Rhizobium mesoamericanum STM3625 TaxID=1211777 RepID=K0Q313_9HYPH|nr:hypothetical protein BN77_4053 [Rhizobium mesoamericanum STM3625]
MRWRQKKRRCQWHRLRTSFPVMPASSKEEERSSGLLLVLIADLVREEEKRAASCSEHVAGCDLMARNPLAGAEHLEGVLMERTARADDVTHGLALASLHRAAVSEARQRGSHI